MVNYIETEYVCVNCPGRNVCLIYEDYGEVKSTMLYCPECNQSPALTTDGKRTDTKRLTKRI